MIGAIHVRWKEGTRRSGSDKEGNSAVCRGEMMGEVTGMPWGL